MHTQFLSLPFNNLEQFDNLIRKCFISVREAEKLRQKVLSLNLFPHVLDYGVRYRLDYDVASEAVIVFDDLLMRLYYFDSHHLESYAKFSKETKELLSFYHKFLKR